MFKAQKGSKDNDKIVHVTSVVHLQFYEAMRILFVCKENKNTDFIQWFCLFCVSLCAIHKSTTMHVCAFLCL